MEERKEGNVIFKDEFSTFLFMVILKKGWKEMFYLTMHSVHFYLWLYGRKEGNVLFNDTFSTFLFMVIWLMHPTQF